MLLPILHAFVCLVVVLLCIVSFWGCGGMREGSGVGVGDVCRLDG